MYTYQTRIRYSELNQTGYLKLEALLDYFQDCSTFHSEDIGLGVSYLLDKHMLWVMSSWQIIVERYPVLGERVTIGTAPYEFKGFIGYRNFIMTDESGQRLAYANTIWSLLDTDKSRPVHPSEEMIGGYVLEPRLDMDYAPRRIQVPGNVVQAERVIIRNHHLDTNHHVNNVQYVRIAMDCLQKQCRVKQLRAEYKRQAVLSDVLVPWIAMPEKGIYVISLQDTEGNTFCVVEIKEASNCTEE